CAGESGGGWGRWGGGRCQPQTVRHQRQKEKRQGIAVVVRRQGHRVPARPGQRAADRQADVQTDSLSTAAAAFGFFRRAARLVSPLRRSYHFAARALSNLGSKGALAKP